MWERKIQDEDFSKLQGLATKFKTEKMWIKCWTVKVLSQDYKNLKISAPKLKGKYLNVQNTSSKQCLSEDFKNYKFKIEKYESHWETWPIPYEV